MRTALAAVACGVVFMQVGYAAAAGTPALAWQARSDWVDVRTAVAPVAVGDGQADDTAALQAGLSAMHDGSVLYLPAGTYRITRTLTLTGPLHGLLVVGHGRDTVLAWDGEAGGRILREDGVAYSRYVGLSFEGRGRAAVGLWHYSDKRFETEVRHQHLAFRGFTTAGILADPGDTFALAETAFENCLFEDCGRGVSFTQFNDYDYTFDGCEFRTCGIGVECAHGNFYVRDCRFEGSREVDILSAPEHGSSVRRCVSVGSHQFLRFGNPVAPMALQDCHVYGWTDPEGAVRVAGAPVMLFDCSFAGGPAERAPVRVDRGGQRLVVSGNRVAGAAGLLQPGHSANVYEIPAGQRSDSRLSAEQRFLVDEARVPSRVLDARRDFGAKGDGNTDDTAALQRTIDAAREHGQGAIAYLPSGSYVVSATLRITGVDYAVGGTGFFTRLVWRGPEGGTLLAVQDPRGVTLEHLAVGNHDSGPMTNAVDIEQTGTGQPSRMTYDGVFVYGMYQKQPLRKGLRFQGLGRDAVVVMPHVQGNLRFVDCGAATILANCSYEGSIVVEGRAAGRDGLLGFQTRLCTVCTHALYLRDNHSIVMSDFYVEQADDGLVFEGGPGLPEGRATIQGAKIHFTPNKDKPELGTALTIRDYSGRIFLGHDQFYVEPVEERVRHTGTAPLSLYLVANSFYNTKLDVRKADSCRLFLVGNDSAGLDLQAAAAGDAMRPGTLAELALALDDLRRLGEADLRLNHPGVLSPARR